MSELKRHPERGSRRIGVDIDGVLADFNRSYVSRIIELAGEDRFGDDKTSPDFPPLWNYPRIYGYSAEIEDEVWRQIALDKGFWLWLFPLDDASAALYHLSAARFRGDEIIFITSRPGAQAKLQTELWLQRYGMSNPTVLISSEKGKMCEALGVEAYIDDKLGNVNDVVAKAPQTRCYLLDQPWNQDGTPGNDAAAADPRVRRVEEIEEFLVKEVVG